MKFRVRNKNSGFTLVELMVVIAIIGIMAGIAIPNFFSFLPKSRLRSATRDIISCLQEMKLRAIKENATTVIVFDLANDRYTAFVDNGPGVAAGNSTLDASESIIKQETLPSDLDMYNTSFVANTGGFTARGLPRNAGTVFISYGNTDYRSVIVNLAGNIRIEMSTDGVNWN
ncbi:MAG: hypothetical protein A3J85_01630 [Desulfobacula sp. RIFOXYA12_FULL_46_16]|nr:MAG: hypothetical protein A2464_02915 [Deltaproteobacteria bacterium RIFOXYC2_FULL_48_10]OGR21056.1 MAG: hypothetical protein A3J85_01630 [Desulfobacula sp. RIFOXYA12_FULL_46_16]